MACQKHHLKLSVWNRKWPEHDVLPNAFSQALCLEQKSGQNNRKVGRGMNPIKH